MLCPHNMPPDCLPRVGVQMRIDLRQSAVIGNANGDMLDNLAEGDEEG